MWWVMEIGRVYVPKQSHENNSEAALMVSEWLGKIIIE